MTPFGKAVRKLRIDREMLLGDMADRLEMTSSYLSQIEKGNKPIPDGLPARIANLLGLDAAATAELQREAVRSTKEFRFKVEDPADRELANQFVTELARLTPEQKSALERVFRRG